MPKFAKVCQSLPKFDWEKTTNFLSTSDLIFEHCQSLPKVEKDNNTIIHLIFCSFWAILQCQSLPKFDWKKTTHFSMPKFAKVWKKWSNFSLILSHITMPKFEKTTHLKLVLIYFLAHFEPYYSAKVCQRQQHNF